MQDFKASRDLEPGDFKRFSAHCIGDVERAKRRLKESEADLRRAAENVEFWRSALSNNLLYCERHGVPLSAV